MFREFSTVLSTGIVDFPTGSESIPAKPQAIRATPPEVKIG